MNGEAPDTNILQFEDRPVRMIDKIGEPWWVAADVCAVLGIANPTRALSSLDEDEKALHTMKGTPGKGDTNIISESGLYKLILRSRKPEAKRFSNWVTKTVLPSLRKTGLYIVPGGESPEQAGALSIIKGFEEMRSDLAEIKEGMALARSAGRDLPEPLGVLPGLTRAEEVRIAAKTLSMLTGMKPSAIWPMVYMQMEVRYKIRLSVRAKKAGWKKSVLDYAIHEGHADKLYGILKHMIDRAMPYGDEGVHRAA